MKKDVILIICCVLISVLGLAASCTSSNPSLPPITTTAETSRPVVQQFTLRVSPNPENGGSFTNIGGIFSAGTSFSLIAKPSKGYKFVSWSGDASGSNDMVKIIINRDMNIIGNFELVSVPSVLFDSAITTATTLINDVLPYTGLKQSDRSAMSFFCNELINKGVPAGLVQINSRLGADGNLDYCIAVNTLDRGIIFLYILPKGFEISNEGDRLQEVYLDSGKQVGLLPIKYTTSNDYSWYKTYLDDIYNNWAYAEYISEFSDIVDKNKANLDSLSSKIDELVNFAENPNISVDESAMSQAQIDKQYNSLLGEVDARIYQFNIYNEQYYNQVREFNTELDAYKIESKKYPDELFCVEEYYIKYSPYSYVLPTYSFPNLTAITPVPFYTTPLYTIDSYLKALQERVNRDYSYSLLSKPDEKVYTAKRLTDKNFVVIDYDIRW